MSVNSSPIPSPKQVKLFGAKVTFYLGEERKRNEEEAVGYNLLMKQFISRTDYIPKVKQAIVTVLSAAFLTDICCNKPALASLLGGSDRQLCQNRITKPIIT